MEGRDRRREPRAEFPIPIAIRAHEPDGTPWADGAVTRDACSSGLCFVLPRALAVGQVLHLELALPRHLRRFDTGRPTYRVFGLVRNVMEDPDGFRIGVMLFGKEPPRGYERRPGARYLLPTDVLAGSPQAAPAGRPLPNHRRRHERFEMLVPFNLQALDEWGKVVEEEDTVCENISEGGARLLTNLGLAHGDVVFLREAGGLFEARGEVRNVYLGDDEVRRVNLMFLDGRTPDQLLRSH